MAVASPQPNFFVVGAPKTGTTAICKYLSEHPAVFLSEPKELFHWCSDFPGQRKVHGMETREAYLARFASADPARHTRIGEGSTHYLVSRAAIPDIARFNPEAKIVAMLRDPVQLAPAYHSELVFNFQEDLTDFAQAWEARERRETAPLPLACPSPHNLRYHDFALFAPQLRRLFAHVAPENRMVILHDDFVADPHAVWAELLAFLDLPPDGRTEFPKIYAARGHRFKGLARLYKSPPPLLSGLSRGVRRAYHAMTSPERREAMRSRLQVSQPREALSPDLRRDLADFFRDDVAETAELLNRDLSHWANA